MFNNLISLLQNIFRKNQRELISFNTCHLCLNPIKKRNGIKEECCNVYFHGKCLFEWYCINDHCINCNYKTKIFCDKTIIEPCNYLLQL